MRHSHGPMTAHPPPPPGAPRADLVAALEELADLLDAPAGELATTHAEAERQHRQRLARDVRASAARARDVDAPLLVVLGGVTGAGKSTVTNSLVGREVVRTGVIRPTTSTPTLVIHPEDRPWFDGDRVLAGLPRVRTSTGAATGEVLVVVEDDAVPVGLALLDAPDVDSVSEANRDLADRLLDAADLWIWFTTAGKYADEESMRYVRRALRRRTPIVIALTQVRPDDRQEVLDDLRAKLEAEGAGDLEVEVVPWSPVEEGQVPRSAVGGLRDRLLPLAPRDARVEQRRRTLDGALDALPAEIAAVTDALRGQLDAARQLTAEAAAAYGKAARDFAAALEEGLPLQDEVLSRWNRFVGGGRVLRLAEEASGHARSWLRSLLDSTADGREERLEREVKVEVADTVADLGVRLGDLAAADVASAWHDRPAGAALLATTPGLDRAGADLRDRTVAVVAAWQDHVVELVATQGAERRTRARWVTTLLNVAATGAIVLALAQTGGLTGAEAGIATAAGAANQTLLARLLGAQNLRWLVRTAREDLAGRFEAVLADERQRFGRAVGEAAPDPDLTERLDEAVAAVEAARR